MNIFIAGLRDGGVMLSKYSYDKAWIYHSPPEELDLSIYGITEIGSIAGNIFQVPAATSVSTTTSIISFTSTSSILTTTIVSSTSTTTIPECKTSSDCDDGLFCNGVEKCVAGECQEGSNPCVPSEGCDEEADMCKKPAVPCEISINPTTTEVVSGGSMSFTVATEGDCEEPNYEWSVESTIGSNIDQNGTYTAGINFDMVNKATDIVKVEDKANGISAEATVTVSFGCPLVQLYGEGSKEVEALRHFRDEVLSQTPEGQELISLYYELSPVVVGMIGESAELKGQVKGIVDGVLPMIREKAD
jgi:hypothetical protein